MARFDLGHTIDLARRGALSVSEALRSSGITPCLVDAVYYHEPSRIEHLTPEHLGGLAERGAAYGVVHRVEFLPPDRLHAAVAELCGRPDVHGVRLVDCLSDAWTGDNAIFHYLPPAKDVACEGEFTVGALFLGRIGPNFFKPPLVDAVATALHRMAFKGQFMPLKGLTVALSGGVSPFTVLLSQWLSREKAATTIVGAPDRDLFGRSDIVVTGGSFGSEEFFRYLDKGVPVQGQIIVDLHTRGSKSARWGLSTNHADSLDMSYTTAFDLGPLEEAIAYHNVLRAAILANWDALPADIGRPLRDYANANL